MEIMFDIMAVIERLWFSGWLALILLAVVWYLGLCLLLKHRPVHGAWFFEQFVRETMFCLSMVLLMPGFLLLLFALILALFIPAASFYERVFSKAISFTTIRYQWNEGADSFSWAIFKTVADILLLVLMLLVLQIGLLWITEVYPVPYSERVPLLVVCCSLFGWLQLRAFSEVKYDLGRWEMPAHLIPRYGYSNVWASEYLYLRNKDLLLRALEARDIRHDRISPREGRLFLPGNLVLLQVESLAYNLLNLEIEGLPVTPFLNRICEDAMLFKLQAIHNNGSCDTDFIMLHAHMPGEGLATYRIPDYPHEDTLPRKTRATGMPMDFLHGQNGWMFNRRDVFGKMDFDALFFKEEMVTDLGMPVTSLGRVADQQVFNLAAGLLEDYQCPHAQMIFTLSTHSPYEDLPQEYKGFFTEKSRDYTMSYCDAMRYFDRTLEEFVSSTAEGTTLVIFGDHEPVGVHDSRISTNLDNELRVEYVPGIVYQKGVNLALNQVTRNDIALAGELTMLDLATWIHQWFDIRRSVGEEHR